MSPSRDQPATAYPSRRKVLVVQAEPTMRLGFAYALANHATAVETAATGTEALERMGSTRFDIVLLELRMPGMDGIRVIETIRRDGDRVPVVLCTTLQHPNATWRALCHGVVDFLMKPAKPADIRKVVEFVLGPTRTPLAEALRAARAGDLESAIQVLAAPSAPDPAEECWLATLLLVQGSDQHHDTSALEEDLRSRFPMLAFNRNLSSAPCRE